MAVETTVADSSETVVVMNREPVEGSSSCNSCSSEQASPDSSCVMMDEQIQTTDQQETTGAAMDTPPPPRRQSSVIRLIRPELLMKEEHVLSATDLSAPRIDVIVNPHQFRPEFRPTMMQQQQQRRPVKRPTNGSSNASAVVSSSTSPGPSSRTPPPVQQQQRSNNNNIVMGPPPPPPPALLSSPPASALPKNGSPVAKSPPGGQQRIRKSTAGAHRRHLALDHAEEPSSSIPEIEFDGTTVLCRVCGDKASGFHYGVHSCEGCKGFFRRSIQQKIQYRPCTKNQQCSILRINRNRCQYCRLKKCIAVGMSRDAVRFGRVPKREKAKILAAMQSVNARLAERSLPAEFADEVQLMQSVVRAHMETCDFTREKVQVLMADAHRQPNYTACPPTLACPLNPTPAPSNGQQQLLQDFSERFLPAIRDVVEFAKRLPGFTLLAEDDKVTLLKPGVFEVLLVRLAAMFDSQSNTMLCLNGQLLRRDALHNSSNARFLMDSMFEFAERLNSLALNDSELGLFCAVVVIAADRPGLRNVELVERMQSKLRSVLENVLNQAHPDKAGLFLELLRKIPDLRTLNTLHSEKLLAFKMTEQQQQQQQQQQQHYNHHAQQQTPPPTASPWHNDRDSYDEEGGAKSPMGSVSSSGAESICSGVEGASSMSDLPLLAAVAGSAVPLMSSGSHRRRLRGPSENGSSSMSSDGEEMDSTGRSLMRIVESPPRTHSAGAGSNAGSCPYSKMRKLDSPDDSGIESGVDRYEKMSTASRSTNTSLCSSPRSSLEDKVKEVDEMQQHHHHHHHHHPAASSGGRVGQSSVDDMPVLKRVLQAPPLFDTNSLMDEAYKPHKKFRALTRCAGSKGEESSPMRVPAVSSPPRSSPTSSSSTPSTSVSVLSAALSSPPGTYSALCSALTSPPSSSSSSSSSSSLLASSLSSGVVSSLTSTHSTLARSLMEGPKMVSTEQQRRADLIVANIMKGNVTGTSPTPSSSSQNYSSLSSNGQQQQQQQQQRTVLTSGPLYAGPSSPSSWNYHHHHHQRSSPVSPPHHHSSPSPSSRIPQQQQPESVSSVGADSQPLNLSLKSPSSSPARPTTPVTHNNNNTHYFPLHA